MISSTPFDSPTRQHFPELSHALEYKPVVVSHHSVLGDMSLNMTRDAFDLEEHRVPVHIDVRKENLLTVLPRKNPRSASKRKPFHDITNNTEREMDHFFANRKQTPARKSVNRVVLYDPHTDSFPEEERIRKEKQQEMEAQMKKRLEEAAFENNQGDQFMNESFRPRGDSLGYSSDDEEDNNNHNESVNFDMSAFPDMNESSIRIVQQTPAPSQNKKFLGISTPTFSSSFKSPGGFLSFASPIAPVKYTPRQQSSHKSASKKKKTIGTPFHKKIKNNFDIMSPISERSREELSFNNHTNITNNNISNIFAGPQLETKVVITPCEEEGNEVKQTITTSTTHNNNNNNNNDDNDDRFDSHKHQNIFETPKKTFQNESVLSLSPTPERIQRSLSSTSIDHSLVPLTPFRHQQSHNNNTNANVDEHNNSSFDYNNKQQPNILKSSLKKKKNNMNDNNNETRSNTSAKHVTFSDISSYKTTQDSIEQTLDFSDTAMELSSEMEDISFIGNEHGRNINKHDHDDYDNDQLSDIHDCDNKHDDEHLHSIQQLSAFQISHNDDSIDDFVLPSNNSASPRKQTKRASASPRKQTSRASASAPNINNNDIGKENRTRIATSGVDYTLNHPQNVLSGPGLLSFCDVPSTRQSHYYRGKYLARRIQKLNTKMVQPASAQPYARYRSRLNTKQQNHSLTPSPKKSPLRLLDTMHISFREKSPLKSPIKMDNSDNLVRARHTLQLNMGKPRTKLNLN